MLILTQMPMLITPNSFGVFKDELSLNGFVCTINLNSNVSHVFFLAFTFTSSCGISIYPEVTLIIRNVKKKIILHHIILTNYICTTGFYYSSNLIQVLLIILDSLLALSIARISRERRKMMGHESGKTGRKELNSAFVILLMSGLPLIVYIPSAVFWAPYILSSVIPNISIQLILLFVQLGYLMFDLSIIVHVWNIFVYTARVSGFRSELLCLLTCGLYKPLVTHSQSSAYTQDKSEGDVN